jgi:glycosyltransferase involved in cell wall biosynthesis
MTQAIAPLVSVVIPAWNAADTIGPTIESVRAQSHPHLEILVADDGSTDSTAAIVRDQANLDPRVRLIEGSHCGHSGAVRNRGLRQARGEFIAFLDADDRWIATKIEDQLAALRRTPSASLCFTQVRTVAPGTAPALERPLPAETASREFLIPDAGGREAFGDLLARRRSIHTSSLLLRRELAEAIGPFSEAPELIRHQNNDYILRAWRAGIPLGLREVYVVVCRRAGSASATSTWEHWFAVLENVEKREKLPAALRLPAWSVAWLVRGERALAADGEAWRGPMARAWLLDPLNPRRAPALLAAALPRGAARRFYGALRNRMVPAPAQPEAP